MSQISRLYALLFMLFCLMVAASLRIPDLQTAPPGLHYDEAANAILATEIGFDGYRPIFITSYTGKEVLFFYVAGGLMRLIGDSVFSLRLTAAFIGILTIAAVYWLGMDLFQDRRIALLAAALLTVSFWHILFSRLGFRAISQPFLQALMVAALLRGYRKNDWRWLAAAGAFLGLAAYTYLAVRLFPALLILALLPVLLNRKNWRVRWGQTAVITFIALIVAAPLMAYFWQNPAAFWVRITQVAPGAQGLTLPESFLKSLGMLFLKGDPYWRFNLPGRPLFDWFWGGLLVVGWLILIYRWRQLTTDWQRTGYLLLILSPFIMILPTALATNEILPSNLRAIGLIPFIFYLPAVGLMTLLDDIHKRLGGPQLTPALFTAGMLLLILGSIYVERLYFQNWAERAEVYLESDGDLTAVANYLNTLDTSNKSLYVAALHYQHPTLAFLSDKYEQIKWLPQSQAVVFPAEGTAVYVFPQRSPLAPWASPYFTNANLLENADAPDGSPAFKAYELSELPSLAISHPLHANFNNTITLLGYDVAPGTANETLPLTLYWQVKQRPAANYAPFVHLEDQWGHRWSQIETFAYPSAQWQAGETIVQRVELPVASGTPPGNYRLRVGLFSPETEEQLPILDDNGRYAGTAVIIPDAIVQAGELPHNLPQPPYALSKEVQPHLRLIGYERGPLEAAHGEPYGFSLWWLATNRLPNTTYEITLTQPNVSYPVIETQPVHNTFPFSDWQTPQFVIDRQTFDIPEDIPAAEYLLTIQFLDEDKQVVAITDLGPIFVTESTRNFTQPNIETRLDTIFGNEIKLLGYTLNHAAEENQYSLALVWQAIQRPKSDYTVFVHLLWPDGRCNPCTWQTDQMPQQGQYPTSRWLNDEIVIDSYQITLPAAAESGSYPLEIGLYIAETGQRLQTMSTDGTESDVVLLEPIVIP